MQRRQREKGEQIKSEREERQDQRARISEREGRTDRESEQVSARLTEDF